MKIFHEPRKAKVLFIVTLIFVIIFLISSGVLGYFYYQKTNDNKNLQKQKKELENTIQTIKGELEKQVGDLKKENETLKTDKANLGKQIADKDAGVKIAKTYTEFLRYLTSVIEAHGGMDDWSESEYQVGRSKAQATGNQTFVNKVDWAWHRKDISQITRIVAIYYAVVEGVNNSLK
jgi:cell division protein FtsB